MAYERDRQRSETDSGLCSVYYGSNHIHNLYYTDIRTAERIKDTVGAPRSFNSCDHYKLFFRRFDTPPQYSVDSTDPETGQSYTETYRYYGAFPHSDEAIRYTAGTYPSLIPPDRAARAGRSFLENATTQIPTELSIANFLLELRNPKELIPRMEAWRARHLASDWLLWWKFGIEPTIRDVKSMLNVLEKTINRLDHLRKINNRTVTLHYRTRVQLEEGDLPTFNASTYDPYNPQYTEHLVAGHEFITITGQVKYELEGLDEPLAFWDSLAATLGLNNPVGIWWENVPFSFVMDWFVDVGDWIDQYNPGKATFDGDITVVSCHHSVKYHHVYDLLAPVDADGYSRGGGLVADGFYRTDGLPTGNLDWTGLSPMQIALGWALIDSRGARSRPRARRRTLR